MTRGGADAPFLIEGPVVLLPGRNEFQVRITTAPRKENVRPGAEVALSLAAVIGGERVELPLGERGARTAGELVPASWLAGSEVTALALQALPIIGGHRSPNCSSRWRRRPPMALGSACSEGSALRRGLRRR